MSATRMDVRLAALLGMTRELAHELEELDALFCESLQPEQLAAMATCAQALGALHGAFGAPALVDELAPAKKPYATPKLVSLGTVGTLTLGGASRPSPDFSTSRKNAQ